jgi:GDPmannose 4,6-dehydratase
MQQKTALITGVTGQDGAYLSEFLLKKNYIVHGIKRRASSFNTERIDHLYQDSHIENQNFFLHYGDLTDSTNLTRIIQEVQPDEIYNLATIEHLGGGWYMCSLSANLFNDYVRVVMGPTTNKLKTGLWETRTGKKSNALIVANSLKLDEL